MSDARPLVAVIGAGQVGATTAHAIARRNLADLALLDVVDGLAAGKALDLMEAAPLEGWDVAVRGSTDYAAVRGAAVIVITAGLARKPGMSREDLMSANAAIVRPIVEQVKTHAPQAILIVVTNPLDVMAQLALRVSGFDRRRVLGMAGVLDSARFRYFIAETLHVSPREVQAMVLGGHGDQMVPLPRYTTIAGVPLPELADAATIERLSQRTRDGGAEVVTLLKTGSAFYAPAASVTEMVAAILLDEHRVLPCACYLDGEYGLKDVFCGVPARLGRAGIEEILTLRLTDQERTALHASAATVQAAVKSLETPAPQPVQPH